MSRQGGLTPNQDLLAAARERVKIGPPPDWVQPCGYNAHFKPKKTGPLSQLLIEQQLHAERHQIFARTVVRLETMVAVEQQSQWRLEFSPSFESVELHSVAILRGGARIE